MEQMTLTPQMIIPAITALTALILLIAGGRLLRPAVGLAGGFFGAGFGLLIAPSIAANVSPLIIALITGLVAAVIAVGIAKFAILIVLAISLAAAAPVITWYSSGLGDGEVVISEVIDAATSTPKEEIPTTVASQPPQMERPPETVPTLSAERAMSVAFQMLSDHAASTMKDGMQRANAAWAAIPTGPRLMLVGTSVAGLLLGLLIATFMPQIAASIVTASFGGVLLIEAIRNGTAVIWSQDSFAAISPSILFVLYASLTAAGLGLQLTVFRRPPQVKAKG